MSASAAPSGFGMRSARGALGGKQLGDPGSGVDGLPPELAESLGRHPHGGHLNGNSGARNSALEHRGTRAANADHSLLVVDAVAP